MNTINVEYIGGVFRLESLITLATGNHRTGLDNVFLGVTPLTRVRSLLYTQDYLEYSQDPDLAKSADGLLLSQNSLISKKAV